MHTYFSSPISDASPANIKFFFLLLSHTAAVLCLCCCYYSTTGPHIHTNQANVFHYSCIHNNHIRNNKTKLYNIDCGGFGKKRLLGAHVYVCAVLLRLHCRFLYGIIFQYWWHLMICSLFLPLLLRLQNDRVRQKEIARKC